jgi:hypothetical protein
MTTTVIILANKSFEWFVKKNTCVSKNDENYSFFTIVIKLKIYLSPCNCYCKAPMYLQRILI